MRLTIIFLAFSCLFFSCSNKKERPITALDTGRDFIRATLDGNLEKADALLVNDSLNKRIFDSYRDFYKRLPEAQKTAYKKAAYNINSYRDINDSVTIINYSNDYMNKPMDIKVVKQNMLWAVDFAFTSGDTAAIK